MSAKRKRSRLIIIAFLSVVASAPIMWNQYWRVPGKLDFLLHQSAYIQMVREAKQIPPPGEKPGHFVKGSTTVYYARTPSNLYTITLVTADWGHIGRAGYLYCDQLPMPVVGDPYSNVDAPGDLWMLEKQIAPHWWVLSNHLK
jgi:hypothetical protein